MHSNLGKVRQILLYLLSNAAKFTKNGTVKLSVSLAEGRGKVNAANPSVTDSSIPAGEARSPIAIACPLPNFQQSDWICSQLAVGSCQLSVVSCQQPTVNSQNYRLPITNPSQEFRNRTVSPLGPIPDAQFSIPNYQLSITPYPLPIPNYLN